MELGARRARFGAFDVRELDARHPRPGRPSLRPEGCLRRQALDRIGVAIGGVLGGVVRGEHFGGVASVYDGDHRPRGRVAVALDAKSLPGADAHDVALGGCYPRARAGPLDAKRGLRRGVVLGVRVPVVGGVGPEGEASGRLAVHPTSRAGPAGVRVEARTAPVVVGHDRRGERGRAAELPALQ